MLLPPPRRRRAALALGGALLLGTGAAALADAPRAGRVKPDPVPESSQPFVGAAPTRLRPPPSSVPVRACARDGSVCVSAGSTVPPWKVLAALSGAERALSAYRALGLPAPRADFTLSGSLAHDVYLVAGTSSPGAHAELASMHGPGDGASSFTVLPPPTGPGCAHGFALAQALAEAVVLGIDAAVEPGTRAMVSSYLASLAVDCPVVELAAIDELQRSPERALTGWAPGEPSGALLFPRFLDEVYGRGAPGTVVTALLSIAGQRTAPGSPRLVDEPDLFDALRATVRDRKSSLEELLVDFAVARAFLGGRSDEGHLVDSARYGDFGRVRFDWSVPYASLPRRLAPRRPIEPTGATYLWVDLSGASQPADLTVVVEWELPAVLRWALVKVSTEGAEVARVELAAPRGVTRAERTLVGLTGLAGVMIVGASAGSMVLDVPFDPDDAPHMPTGYTVTVHPTLP